MVEGIAVLAAVCGGIAVGIIASLAFAYSQRSLRPLRVTAPVEPVEDAVKVLEAIPQFFVLVSALDVVERASTQAYSFGLVRDDRLVRPEFIQLVARVRDTGEVLSRPLSIKRSTLKNQSDTRLMVYAAPLSGGRVLVLFEDNTEKLKLEETRRDFVANVSHELKTPVGAISLLVETLESAADDPEAVRHFTAQLDTEVVRLRGLVQDIIELSRLQEGNALTTTELVDVDAVVAESVARMDVEAANRGVKIVSGGQPGLTVYGDRRMLATAVRNLLDNAVRYTRPHGRVSVATSLADGQVLISVVDQGEGIDAAQRERIFERFYRGDAARDRNSGGSGIGLAIVKHVVQDHGGRIKLWSKVGQGSTFTICLPEPYIPEAAPSPETNALEHSERK
ncbi:sensor histidine kinase [Actinotignum sanguinis]|uniref:Sensor-like histidine kinase SenX3 n=2 Tax=Actinomycetaceae TaxID=2049 RepID=A0ABZ0RHT2_9ACTO|nr:MULTISPECIES: ATP-binding protein [Actinotignum]MDK6645332.1 ATP-binding protein [Actinotignum timonense]WPJ88496.1 ATP-binding protein [Schaalia turicensis]MDE1655739.1 ATP-binding protein [Actinotignum sanguinis]MDK7196859.1 ATP-binding protein [Actinotignum sanguinis]MDK8512870.1 ATP-binding protein [Actinotignum sanguinis]